MGAATPTAPTGAETSAADTTGVVADDAADNVATTGGTGAGAPGAATIGAATPTALVGAGAS